jgi:ribosome-associated protein
MIEHPLKGEFIELIKLLKFSGIAGTGGEAKMLVEEGEVTVNGQVENRKRCKIRKGDKIEARGEMITVI